MARAVATSVEALARPVARGQLVVVARPEPVAGAYARGGKRVLDLVLGSVLLLLVAPALLAMMVLVVVTSDGPALFRQTRVGRGGTLFEIYKLRTMTVGAPCVDDGDGVARWQQIREDADARVTGVGRFLRALSIDELPQLINVVRGEMSLVGPRPELPELVDTYRPWQHVRHDVRPGMTGPWQLSPHRNEPMVEHLDYDIDYVRAVRLGCDVNLLVRTIPAVVGLGGSRLGS